jgi:uncharacterized hydrophobic protein (TIGR00271 family)
VNESLPDDRPTRFDSLFRWLPNLPREERLRLIEEFQRSASWNIDFIVMMGLASALASLGLLASSVPVVIGAMLVAPLMSPLAGAGFAIVQGNIQLFQESLRAMSYGILVSLAVSVGLGLLSPDYQTTLEMEARGEVNLLDLGVALASGMAAAYAMARPNVAATIAGVAIAAALVPPLAVVGIAAAYRHWPLCGAASANFLTNLFAIVLGAAFVFRAMGVNPPRAAGPSPRWARRTLLVLVLVAIAFVLPLGDRMLTQAKRGQRRPMAYAASQKVRQVVYDHFSAREGVEVLLIGRDGIEPESGVAVLLACTKPIGADAGTVVTARVREVLGKPIPVHIYALQSAWQVKKGQGAIEVEVAEPAPAVEEDATGVP